jgi:hypothetical protein
LIKPFAMQALAGRVGAMLAQGAALDTGAAAGAADEVPA